MFEELEQYIIELAKENSLYEIDEVDVESNKASFSLSNSESMFSIEILSDLTCDLMKIDAASDDLIFSDTKKFSDLASLKVFIQENLC